MTKRTTTQRARNELYHIVAMIDKGEILLSVECKTGIRNMLILSADAMQATVQPFRIVKGGAAI